MLRLCTFLDYDPWFKADSTGHNKVGYVTTRDTVIYPVRRHIVEVPIEKLLRKMRGKKLIMLDKSCPQESESKVESFFTDNVLNPGLIKCGHLKLFANEFEYFDCPIRLPKLKPIDVDEHRRRWEELLAHIKEGDLVQVIDTSSLVSRLIAKVDIGTWSHSAGYIGNGNLIEAITSGVVERSIGVYSSHQYRIGLYRHPDLSISNLAKMNAFARSTIGAKYSWKAVVRLGWKKLLRLKRYKRGEVSPNDLMSVFDFRLIHIV